MPDIHRGGWHPKFSSRELVVQAAKGRKARGRRRENGGLSKPVRDIIDTTTLL